MIIRFQKLSPKAVTPTRAHETDAGFDLTAISWDVDLKNGCATYYTGLAVEIPRGFFGAIFPRSSIFKTAMFLSNSVGVIDSGYRGEIQFRFRIAKGGADTSYQSGDRIGQLVILPLQEIEFEEALVLSDSDRGDKGFGSTDKKP